MPREARQFVPGGLYHVIARGNRGQEVFLDDADRARFLTKLQEHLQVTGCILYAFVLMPNHVHLLLGVGNEPLATLMQPLLTSHVRWFNNRHGRSGHLFQGPYQAILCQRESHLLELIRYLHLNPVRAGLCGMPQEYAWSSHSDYVGRLPRPWIAAGEVLSLFSFRQPRAHAAYERFVAEGMGQGYRPDLHPGGRRRTRITRALHD